MGGNFTGTSSVGGNTNLVSVGASDAFIAKYNSQGSLQWAKPAGNTDYDGTNDLVVTGVGQVTVVGEYAAKITIGSDTLPHTGDAGTSDLFMSKCTTSGTLLCTKSITGDSHDQSSGLAIAADGDVLLTGYFSSPQLNIDGTLLNNPDHKHVFIARFGPNGGFGYAFQAGGSGNNNATAVAIDGHDILIGGNYNTVLTFGYATLHETGFNCFLAHYRLGTLGNGDFDANDFKCYPNPIKDVLHINSRKLAHDERFILYDVTGKVAAHGQLNDRTINLEALSSGLYFLRIADANRKVVKE